MKINALRFFIFLLVLLAVMDYISNKNHSKINRIKSSKKSGEFGTGDPKSIDIHNFWEPKNGYNHYGYYNYNDAGVYSKGPKQDFANYKPQSVDMNCPKGYKRISEKHGEIDYLFCYIYFQPNSEDVMPIWTGDFSTSYCCTKTNMVWPVKTCEQDNSYVSEDRDKNTCPKIVNQSTGQFHFLPCYKVLDNKCCIKNDCNQEKTSLKDWAFGIPLTYKNKGNKKFDFTAGVTITSANNFYKTFKGVLQGSLSKTPQPKSVDLIDKIADKVKGDIGKLVGSIKGNLGKAGKDLGKVGDKAKEFANKAKEEIERKVKEAKEAAERIAREAREAIARKIKEAKEKAEKIAEALKKKAEELKKKLKFWNRKHREQRKQNKKL